MTKADRIEIEALAEQAGLDHVSDGWTIDEADSIPCPAWILTYHGDDGVKLFMRIAAEVVREARQGL